MIRLLLVHFAIPVSQISFLIKLKVVDKVLTPNEDVEKYNKTSVSISSTSTIFASTPYVQYALHIRVGFIAQVPPFRSAGFIPYGRPPSDARGLSVTECGLIAT